MSLIKHYLTLTTPYAYGLLLTLVAMGAPASGESDPIYAPQSNSEHSYEQHNQDAHSNMEYSEASPAQRSHTAVYADDSSLVAHPTGGHTLAVVSESVFQETQDAINAINITGLGNDRIAKFNNVQTNNWLFWGILGLGTVGIVGVVLWYKLGYLDQMPIAWKLYAGVGILLSITLAIGFESHIFQKKLSQQEELMEHALKIEFEAERAARAEQAFKNLVIQNREAAQGQLETFNEATSLILQE